MIWPTPRAAAASDVCAGGTPRIFIQGGRYNTHDASRNGGVTCANRTSAPDADGWRTVTGTLSNLNASTAGHVGIVNDHQGNIRTMEVRNVRIAGTSLFASSADECKKGGWAEAGYRNQGQCVSSFAKAR